MSEVPYQMYIYSRWRKKTQKDSKLSTHGKFAGKSTIWGLSTARVYMVRYFVGLFRVHIMHRGDAGRHCHDHPWWFLTFPLRSYIEEVMVETGDPEKPVRTHFNRVKAWRLHYRPAFHAHRIYGPSVYPHLPLEFEPYKPGMSLDEIDAMYKTLNYPERKRKITTLVLRGRVKHAWGFYHPDTADWTPNELYFKQNGHDQ